MKSPDTKHRAPGCRAASVTNTENNCAETGICKSRVRWSTDTARVPTATVIITKETILGQYLYKAYNSLAWSLTHLEVETNQMYQVVQCVL